jgi:transcriptional regulator with XRE-family HTH domain
MNDVTVGRSIRILRLRLGWRQRDLAREAGVSQGLVSLLERGLLDHVALRKVRAVLDALDAGASLDVRWRGGILDRLLDERHATLVGTVASLLTGWGWEVVPEVSYSVFGERGSIDLIAWHAASRTLLIIEVKTDLVSVEGTLRKLDEKVRLGPKIIAERFGWRPALVGRLLILPADRTQRRHVERHAAVLDRALPVRGRAVRAWLRRPHGNLAGLWFVTDAVATDAVATDLGAGVDRRRRGPARPRGAPRPAPDRPVPLRPVPAALPAPPRPAPDRPAL